MIGQAARRKLAAYWPIVLSTLLATATFAFAAGLYPTPMVVGDAYNYSVSAARLAAHGYYAFWGENPDTPRAPDAQIMPGYPVFLAAFYSFTDSQAPFVDRVVHVHPFVLAVQFMFAIGTVALISASALTIGGIPLSIGAGVFAALYLPLAWASRMALTETLFTFLMCAQLLLAVLIVDTRRSPSRLVFFLFGLFTGLAALVRSAQILWAVIPALCLLAQRRIPFTTLLRLAALVLLGFTLVFGPWWVRNAVVLDRFVPLNESQIGVVRIAALGGAALSPSEQVLYDQAKVEGKDAYDVVATSRFRKEWAKSPSEFILSRLRNVENSLYSPYIGPYASYYYERTEGAPGAFGRNPALAPRVRFSSPTTTSPAPARTAEALTVSYQRLLLALAVVGLLFVRRWPRLLLVASVVVYTILVYASLLVLPRYLFPIMPAVALLAGAAVSGVILWLNELRIRPSQS